MKRNRTLDLLHRFESRNITYLEQDGSWPIVWCKARGVHVWDDGGRKYLDLTAAFGVAAAGHANLRVVRAAEKQMRQLLHAMGDVHPHERKAELARELSRITFERWQAGGAKTIFCNSGFEAVEAAFKTAFLATGRSRVIAFEGAYHGLGYGALNATHRTHFRSPFRSQLAEFATFVPFPESEAALPNVVGRIEELARSWAFGAILIEPIQARGGMRVPPSSFLPSLQRIAHANGMLLILDEIYTGFGRTGRWFACEHSRTIPDLICLGKALTGGFPLSACVGKSDLMDAAWPSSTGEAIHTSTFLGHPVGCAMALANIKEIVRLKLPAAVRTKSHALSSALKQIHSSQLTLRLKGLGLMMGLEIVDQDDNPATDAALGIIKNLLHAGFIFLPEGEFSNVISFTPPLIITEAQLQTSVSALRREIESL